TLFRSKFQKIALVSFFVSWLLIATVIYFSLPRYLLSFSLLSSILVSSALLFPYLIDIFEERVRCSGVGVVFNSCISIFSGFLPVANSWVISFYGFEMLWYIIFSMLLMLYAYLFIRSRVSGANFISIST